MSATKIHGHEVKHIPTLDVLEDDYLYAPGKQLGLSSHQPPQPFGKSDYTAPFDLNTLGDGQETLKSRSPRDHVFTRVPRERADNSLLPAFAHKYFYVNDEATIEIVQTLSIGDGVGPQVVLCTLNVKNLGRESRSEPDKLDRRPNVYWSKMGCNDRPVKVVAKIYDPLFYPKQNPFGPWEHLDVVSYADQEYAQEAASYMELHELQKRSPMIRDFTPRFYGSWTTTIQNNGYGMSDTKPSDGNTVRSERPVRMLLMEYIEGDNIWDVCTKRYEGEFPVLVPPQKFEKKDQRLKVLACLMRGLVALEHAGLFKNSDYLNPRDFILVEPEHRKEPKLQNLGTTRVVMVGYGRGLVTRYTKIGKFFQELFPRPVHPISRFTPDKLDAFTGWFPQDWLEDIEPFYEWAQKIFRKEDFTWHDEANEIIDRDNAELADKKEEVGESATQSPGQRPGGLSLMVAASREVAKGASEEAVTSPDSSASSPENPKLKALKQGSRRPSSIDDSSDDAPSVFEPGSHGSSSTATTLASRRRESGSSQTGQSSRLTKAWNPDDPSSTAKDAGMKAEDAGITTVAEGDEGNKQDDEEEEEQSTKGDDKGKGKSDDEE